MHSVVRRVLAIISKSISKAASQTSERERAIDRAIEIERANSRPIRSCTNESGRRRINCKFKSGAFRVGSFLSVCHGS